MNMKSIVGIEDKMRKTASNANKNFIGFSMIFQLKTQTQLMIFFKHMANVPKNNKTM